MKVLPNEVDMMNNKSRFTKALAIGGSVLVWLPILAPLVFMVVGWIRRGFPLLDYLMPAELFLLAFLGGGLLLWAALRTKTRRRLIGASLGASLLLLVASQAVAVVSGMASGEIEPSQWLIALVMGLLAGYIVAVVIMGIGGILLIQDHFHQNGTRKPGFNDQTIY